MWIASWVLAVYRNTETENNRQGLIKNSVKGCLDTGVQWRHTYRRYTCMHCSDLSKVALQALAVSFLWSANLHAASSSLIDATMAEDVASVRNILKGSADVNASATDGTTPLHWAVRAENVELVDLLISSKANVRAANRYGVTPLYVACSLRKCSDRGETPDSWCGCQCPRPKRRDLAIHGDARRCSRRGERAVETRRKSQRSNADLGIYRP